MLTLALWEMETFGSNISFKRGEKMTNFDVWKQNVSIEYIAKLNILMCAGCAYEKSDENCMGKTCVEGQIEWLSQDVEE
jgi:hypothetical protein